ncbi:unnamed protein product [Auanema sp. JU1783]|nr:unnamed protein product [Auanema sp. JU1783]
MHRTNQERKGSIVLFDPVTRRNLPFDYNLPDESLPQFSHYSNDEWVIHTFKLFVGKCFKPMVTRWLLSLCNARVDDFKRIGGCGRLLEEYHKIINSVSQVLSHLKASPKACEEGRALVPLCLFLENEVVTLGKKFTPFFILNFRIFYKKLVVTEGPNMKTFEGLCGSLNECLGQSSKYKLDLSNAYLDTQREILQNIRLCPLFSNMGLRSVMNIAFMRAHHTITYAFIDYVYTGTGCLSEEIIDVVADLMAIWTESVPEVNNKPDAESGQIPTQSPLTTEMIIVDYLIEKIYRLAVTDYPKSVGTIHVLRMCMEKNNDYGRERLVDRLVNDVSEKLLNVAEDTTIMLDGYASCVESLKELDPSCSIMHKVCSVIKEYLKTRPDTVKKIINYITSEKRDQLSKQLISKKGTILDEEFFAGTNDEFLPESMDNTGWEEWKPDPPDAPLGQSGRFRQSADVFNMLISVYGSKELFVKEYRKLLAERLMSYTRKDTTFEKRYLDVLKLRFNDGELQQCEVMLKDVEDSIRFDTAAAANVAVPINSCIISSHFWPTTEQGDVAKLPEELERSLDLYEGKYKESKTGRKLNWLRARGFADVTLEIGGVTVEKVVSNDHAAVLYLYLIKEEWAAADVAEELKISKSVAKRRLEWWTSQGLLNQELPRGGTCEVWKLISAPTQLDSTKQSDESEDEDEAALDDAADAIDALEVYWMYTKNFIAQNDNVKAERIHRMYKLFGSPSSQCPSLETVTAFLFRKVKANLLEYNNGQFKVVKDST